MMPLTRRSMMTLTPTRGRAVTPRAASTGVTLRELKAAPKSRVVVDLDGYGKVLLQEFMGDVYAVSNKCPHLGLSMQGKTELLSAKVNDDCSIVCPAHGSTFDMKTGAAKGEWCPNLPTLPVVGKPFAGEPKGIATYAVTVDESSGAISIA
jgi:nitrite reductase/ring-hydroxylating ferredoxin subunit